MPPRKKRATAVAAQPRRSTRQNAVTNAGVPDVYQQMLEEVKLDSAEEFEPSPRSAKRRRVSNHDDNDADSIDDLFESPPPSNQQEHVENLTENLTRQQQIVYDDFEGSDSEESDVEFEDIELQAAPQSASEDERPLPKSIQIDLSKPALETSKRAVQRRKPVTKAERLLRLDVHKWHLLSLIGHGLHRNAWCNNDEIHAILKPLVPRRLIKLLHIDESKPMYERNYSFTKGVEEISTLWRQQWKTTVAGLRRPYWREDVDARTVVDEGEDIGFEDFTFAAEKCSGSRDLGAQLFVALLRSIAVDVRLVFSLQILPFTAAAKTDAPPGLRTNRAYIKAPAQDYGVSANTVSPFAPPSRTPKKAKKIVDSAYPVFWAEILAPNQTWTPLDPIVRNSIGKPKTQFEPPLSDNLNSMTYVMAFEEDNSAHDVTRRYAQWYNAKTRRSRVESTKNGEAWYTSAMKVLQKRLYEPRDEMEEDELSKRLNSEGMPHNIQDFKNHPVYVLERHMRANEVLEPKREVGKVNVGTSKNGKMETVYRRQDVYLCRTADAWYRRGRDVKVGEQPLKLVQPKARKAVQEHEANFSDEEDGESDGVGLYAEYQTRIYEPPPVMDGQIPKNAYGNLDIYVPSMIPPRAVHVSHTLAGLAARTISIDFADAVTGFEFKGRQGTAIVNGVVIAEEYTAAIAAVIDGLERLGTEEVQESRSRILLAMWKRLLQALRVRDKVETEYGSNKPKTSANGGRDDEQNEDDEDDSTYEADQSTDEDAGGGFMLEAEPTEEKEQEQAVHLQVLKSKGPAVLPEEVVSVPIKVTRSPHKSPVKTQDAHYDLVTTNGAADELFDDNNDAADTGGRFVQPDTEDVEMEGGFMPDDNEEQSGGGFFADEGEDDSVNQTSRGATKATTPHMHPSLKAQVFGQAADTLRETHPSDVSEITSAAMAEAMELLHSDTEEDSALQQAIAQSLTSERVESDEVVQAEPVEATMTEQKPESEPRSPTSLLSHDPNEDDEEPEWLNDALE